MNKLAQMANALQSIGASGSNDSVLAHITPREAAMLKARGGSGRRDPNTGLLHFDDDSESYSTGTPGSYNNYAGTQGYSVPSSYSEYTGTQQSTPYQDPGVSQKGYYSAGGNYDNNNAQGSGSTRYYADRRTVGGEIANAFGADPEGWGAALGNGVIRGIGFLNPMSGMVGKIAQASIGAQSNPHLADSEGNGASLNALGRLLGNDKLANKLGMTVSPNYKRSEEEYQSKEQQKSTPTKYSQYTPKKKKKIGEMEYTENHDWLYV